MSPKLIDGEPGFRPWIIKWNGDVGIEHGFRAAAELRPSASREAGLNVNGPCLMAGHTPT